MTTLHYEALHRADVSEAEVLADYLDAAHAAGLAATIDGPSIQFPDNTRLLCYRRTERSHWNVSVPSTEASTQWLERMAAVARHVARCESVERIAIKREPRVEITPSPPLAESCHLLVTSEAVVKRLYEDTDTFWSAWDHVERCGERAVCWRAFDAVDDESWLRRTVDDSLALTRVSRAHTTAYAHATGAPLHDWLAQTALKRIDHDAATRTLTLAFVGGHLTVRDLLDLRGWVYGERDEDGRPIALVRVVFADEAAARREARPLLDHHVRVVFPGGELCDVPPRQGPVVACELVPWGCDSFRLRLGGGELLVVIRPEHEQRSSELIVPSSFDARAFVDELARDLDVDVPAAAYAAGTRAIDAHGGLRGQHPTFGRMTRYELGFARAKLDLWQYPDGSQAFIDGFTPSPEVVVKRLAALLAPDRDATPAFVRGAERLREPLGPFCHRGGALWATPGGARSRVVYWPDGAAAPIERAELPGRAVELLPSPDGAHVAVIACSHANADGSFWSDAPHDVWLVSASGGARKLLGSDEQPFGVAWSPTSDQLAIGGVADASRLCIVGLDGTVLDEPSVAHLPSLWVKAWIAEGIVVSVAPTRLRSFARGGLRCMCKPLPLSHTPTIVAPTAGASVRRTVSSSGSSGMPAVYHSGRWWRPRMSVSENLSPEPTT